MPQQSQLSRSYKILTWIRYNNYGQKKIKSKIIREMSLVKNINNMRDIRNIRDKIMTRLSKAIEILMS